MPRTQRETTADLAAEWGCDPRTLYRWRREGAPLSDPARMPAWLAGRKNLPAPTKRKLAEVARARRARATAEPAHQEGEPETATTGAPAALKRLEQQEMSAFKLLQSALASGDALEIKTAREGWLKVGDSLRRYDLLVERERRQSGEMIQRTEIERHVSNLLKWFKLAIVRTSSAMAPQLAGMNEPAEIDAFLKTVLLEHLLNGIATSAASPCPARVPEWLIAAMVRPINDTLEGATEATRRRAEAFEDIFNAMVGSSVRRVASV